MKNPSDNQICECGHFASMHTDGEFTGTGECYCSIMDDGKKKFCKCKQFKPRNTQKGCGLFILKNNGKEIHCGEEFFGKVRYCNNCKLRNTISPDFIGDKPETMKEGTIEPKPRNTQERFTCDVQEHQGQESLEETSPSTSLHDVENVSKEGEGFCLKDYIIDSDYYREVIPVKVVKEFLRLAEDKAEFIEFEGGSKLMIDLDDLKELSGFWKKKNENTKRI